MGRKTEHGINGKVTGAHGIMRKDDYFKTLKQKVQKGKPSLQLGLSAGYNKDPKATFKTVRNRLKTTK